MQMWRAPDGWRALSCNIARAVVAMTILLMPQRLTEWTQANRTGMMNVVRALLTRPLAVALTLNI